MSLKKSVRRTGAVLLAAAVTVGALRLGAGKLTARADDTDDLELLRQDLIMEIAGVEEQIAELEDQNLKALAEKVLLDEKIALTTEELQVVGLQLESCEAELAASEEETARCADAEQQQLDAYKTRIRAMEEGGIATYYEVLMGATSFRDFLERMDVIGEIMDWDNTMRNRLRTAREDSIRAQTDLAEKMDALEAKQTEQRELFDSQEAERARATNLVADINAHLDEYREYAELLNNAEAEVNRQLDQIAADIMTVRTAESAQPSAEPESYDESDEDAPASTPTPTPSARPGKPGTTVTPTPAPTPTPEPEKEEEEEETSDPVPTPRSSSTGFIWPTSRNIVTSEWGDRLHPIFGEVTHHGGMDIDGNAGDPIYAVADGEVIASEYDEDGLGNYVAILHPDGTTTVYAHMSERGCEVGDTVGQGQTIGEVGDTGWADGDHLHFSVRVDGEDVDPAQYYSPDDYWIWDGE